MTPEETRHESERLRTSTNALFQEMTKNLVANVARQTILRLAAESYHKRNIKARRTLIR